MHFSQRKTIQILICAHSRLFCEWQYWITFRNFLHPRIPKNTIILLFWTQWVVFHLRQSRKINNFWDASSSILWNRKVYSQFYCNTWYWNVLCLTICFSLSQIDYRYEELDNMDQRTFKFKWGIIMFSNTICCSLIPMIQTNKNWKWALAGH